MLRGFYSAPWIIIIISSQQKFRNIKISVPAPRASEGNVRVAEIDSSIAMAESSVKDISMPLQRNQLILIARPGTTSQLIAKHQGEAAKIPVSMAEMSKKPGNAEERKKWRPSQGAMGELLRMASARRRGGQQSSSRAIARRWREIRESINPIASKSGCKIGQSDHQFREGRN